MTDLSTTELRARLRQLEDQVYNDSMRTPQEIPIELPTYDDPTNAAPEDGHIIWVTGKDSAYAEGVYRYDGSEYLNVTDTSTGLVASTSQSLQVAPIPTTTLADTEFISFRVHVPSNHTLYVWAVGVQNASNNAPAGLTAEVDDETNTTNLVSQNAKRATGNPLASVSGAVDVAFRVENDTGGSQDATAAFAYTIEE